MQAQGSEGEVKWEVRQAELWCSIMGCVSLLELFFIQWQQKTASCSVVCLLIRHDFLQWLQRETASWVAHNREKRGECVCPTSTHLWDPSFQCSPQEDLMLPCPGSITQSIGDHSERHSSVKVLRMSKGGRATWCMQKHVSQGSEETERSLRGGHNFYPIVKPHVKCVYLKTSLPLVQAFFLIFFKNLK